MNPAQKQLKDFLESLPDDTAKGCMSFVRRVKKTGRLGEVALRRGLITHNQLGEALRIQGQLRCLGREERIGQILVRGNALTEQTLEALLA